LVGVTYGEVTEPITIGAGGLVGGPGDGHGGGAIHVTVAGAVTNDGTIDARAYPSTSGPSAGAGGSVYLRAGSLAGSGSIQANGDKMGGGGRVAVILTNSTSFGSVALQAYGGAGDGNGNYNGAAGTVYREVQGQSAGCGTLVIDNNNQAPPWFGPPYFNNAATLMPTASVWNAAVNLGNFAEVIVTNKGTLGISRDTALNWTTAALRFAGVTNSYVSLSSTNLVTLPASMVVSNYTLLLDTPLSVAGTWIVRTNGAISCLAADDRSQPPLRLSIDGDLTVDAGASITVEAMGYRNNTGPGVGQWSPNRGGGHGGQGGVGSWSPGQTYGSIMAPTNMGSGGVSGGNSLADGGGAMRLFVSGTCTVNGTLNAGAKSGYSGAGGAIWLKAGSLAGSGSIAASGASGSSGGGGRVSVVLTNGTSFDAVSLRAFGGSGGTPGAAGTVFRHRGDQLADEGEVVINNNSLTTTTNMMTHLPPSSLVFTDYLAAVSFSVTNKARVSVTTNVSIGDLNVDSTSFIYLNGRTVTVNRAEHALAGTVVSNGGAIVWLPLTLSIADAPGVVEGASGTTTSAVFAVTLSRSVGSDVSFQYSTVNGTAAAPDDFTAASLAVGTIAAGSLQTNIVVAVNGDDLIEPHESFSVAITNAAGGGATLGVASGSCTVSNDDARTVSVSGVTVNEGNPPDTTNAVFTVTLSQAIGTPVTFGFGTVDGSAVAPGDYVAAQGAVGSIGPWQTQTSLVVVVNGDNAPEGVSEQFTLVLSNLSGNATFAASTGTCTIVDDDGLPVLSIADTAVTEGPAGAATAAVFAVTLSAPGTGVVTFAYDTADVTAVSPGDYAAVSGGSVSIPVGVTATSIVIAVQGDPWIEGNESFRVVLGPPVNAALNVSTGTCTILDDDYPLVWTGAGTNSLASNTNNWTRNGVKPAAPPGTTDVIRLDATSTNPVTWNGGTNGLATRVQDWIQTEGYSGTVTVLTVYPGSGAFTEFEVAGACVVSNGAWTHMQTPAGSTPTYRLSVRAGGDFVLGSNAQVTAKGLGFRDSSGPGVGQNQARGGSHGGQGGGVLPAGVTYGSATNPATLGSGGVNGGDSIGAAGGGAIAVTVGGQARIDGTLDAGARAYGAAGGAGGSILIRAGSVAGSGMLQADGYGMGGGGRVALIVTNAGAFGGVSARAYGGDNNSCGAAGTVYLESTNHVPGRGLLIVDNGNRVNPDYGDPLRAYGVTLMPTNSSENTAVNLNQFAAVIVTNRGVLGVNADTALDFAAAALRLAGRDASYVCVRGTNALAFPPAFVVSNFTLLADVPLSIPGDMAVSASGAVSRTVETGRGQGDLTLAVQGSLNVAAGGRITVKGMGYRDNTGPGVGLWAPARGASHGGQGAVTAPAAAGVAYGSVRNPVTAGSGGVSGNPGLADGGGAMRLTVAGAVQLDGELDADAWALGAAGGAGGSIRLEAANLAGTGSVHAIGHNMGGGGRVAVYLTQGSEIGSVALRAYGGDYTSGGAAGSVYLETSNDVPGRGRLLLDNDGRTASSNAAAVLLPTVQGIADELAGVVVSVSNTTRVAAVTNTAIRDLVMSTNSFLALSANTLTIDALEHRLDNRAVRGRGATNLVDQYEQILWIGKSPGTVFIFR